MFNGFSPETVDFLWGIRLNNNREWFTANKKPYTDYLYEPMKALGWEIFQPFVDSPGTIYKVSRIYRDARMHPPTPYKESLWICIRQDVAWWQDNPCLFFEITPEGISYGFFFWRPTTAALENFRREIAAHPDDFLKLIRDTEKATGFSVRAECYKRPKPCDNPNLAPYYAWKGAIGCSVELPFGEDTFGPGLADRVKETFEKLKPLYQFFTKFGN